MSTSLILTIVADDQPGIVEAISAKVADHHGNWMESRMSHMAGKFAGILRIGVSEADAPALTDALTSLNRNDLALSVETSNDSGDSISTKDLTLSLVGNDCPGIVKEVSQVLATKGVNVLELITNCESAAMSADPLFKAEVHLRVPERFDSDVLADALENISNDLMVEIQLD